MNFIRRLFPSISQRAAENIAILVFTLVLHLYAIGTIPPFLHIFEYWVDSLIPILGKDWGTIANEFLRFHHNDSNANVNSPPWVLLIALSQKIFSDPLLAHRVPSVIITALNPVILAEIVRRFYRKDLALFAGLLLATNQNLIHFGRIAGYIGPTTTLLSAMMLCTMSIVWEQKRKAWVPLVLMLCLVPFMYSTVRYMALMVAGLIGWTFVTSKEFRRKQLLPMLISLGVLFAALLPFSQGGVVSTVLTLFAARGEQVLISDRVVLGSGAQSDLGFGSRVIGVLKAKIPEKGAFVIPHYTTGKRFFHWHYQEYKHDFHWYLALVFGVGLLRAVVQSFWQPRYLVMVGWSVWTWFPLLFTTGLTVNRMLNGLPADMFLVTLGGAVGLDVLKLFVAPRLRWVLYALTAAMVGYVMWFSVNTYFIYLSDFSASDVARAGGVIPASRIPGS